MITQRQFSTALRASVLAAFVGCLLLGSNGAGTAVAQSGRGGPDGAPRIFMKIDGHKGPSKVAGHADWFELESCQWNISRSVAPRVRGRTNVSSPVIADVTVSKMLDFGTPQLVSEALTGSGKKVEIEFVRGACGRPYFKLELEGTIVSSYSISASSEVPQESLSLNFAKITLTSLSTDAAKPAIVTYDVEAQKAQ